MRNKSILIIIISLLVIIFHEYILVMGYTCYLTAKHIVIDVVPETFNRIVYIKDNNEAYDKYIESKYGIISKTFEMHNDGRFYYISTPFLKNEFVIQLTHGKVVSDRFYGILLTDSKFQHLYSEWVKKQIGIEDENVEFQFAGNFDNPYIEFDKITSLSEDYREIFENTHNLYCNRCYVSNIDNLNAMTANEIANEIREEYLSKAVEITNIPKEKISGNIHLSTGTFKKDIDKSFKYRFDLHNFTSELIIQN